MKCSKCNVEWTIPDNSSIETNYCPFCGKKISSTVNKAFNTVEDVIREILIQFGADTLKNGKRTIAIFSDLAPLMHGERLLLSYLIQIDGNNKLLGVRNKSYKEQQACFLQVCKHMVEHLFVAENAAHNICMSFSTAIGLKVNAINTKENVTSTNQTLEKKSSSGRSSAPFYQAKSTIYSTEITPSASRKQTSSSTSVPRPKAIINNFEQYRKALEDYYLSLGKIPLSENQIRNFLSTNSLDRIWGVTVADVQKDLATIYAKFNPPKPSPNNTTKINSFTQYQKALEEYYIRLGKAPLSESQIRHFISSNALDRVWGITVSDVQQDLKTIYNKNLSYVHPPKPKTSTNTALTFPKNVNIYTYPKYLAELEQAYLRNGRVMLSKSQIVAFLDAYGLRKNFGILVSEVEKDLSEIAKKYS